MTKKISAALLVLLALVAAAPAHASTQAAGYVCTVALYPASFSQANGLGTEGTILLTLNSLPDCAGVQNAYVYLFSVGATYPATNTSYLYAGADLRAIFESIMTSRNKSSQRIIQLGIANNQLQGLGVAFE